MKEENQFLSAEQAAEYLKISKRTLYRYVNKELYPLPCYRINKKKILIAKSEIDTWLMLNKAIEGLEDIDDYS